MRDNYSSSRSRNFFFFKFGIDLVTLKQGRMEEFFKGERWVVLNVFFFNKIFFALLISYLTLYIVNL